jgi:hypothetical protein
LNPVEIEEAIPALVGRRATGPDLDTRPARRVGQRIEIQRIVTILEECRLAAIAALGE